jgi:CRISPR/Cas system CMR-associated protein Cmr5 small subunit
MKKKHQVHNLIILDESGSMMAIKDFIIQGFNELVQTVKGIAQKYPEQEHFISMVSFNGLGHQILHYTNPIEKLEQIDASNYNPNASTPLFDAMGYSFAELRKVLKNTKDYNVLVTIMTDGLENASKEYDGIAIRNLIEELKLERWTFTYIGTDHDVESFSKSISIDNTMSFEKNQAGIKDMFDKEKYAREMYSKKIRANESTDTDFYDNPEDKV